MLLWIIYALCAITLSRAVDEVQQFPLAPESVSRPGDMPGSSIVGLCPESRDTDVLAIKRIANRPQIPYLYVISTIWQST